MLKKLLILILYVNFGALNCYGQKAKQITIDFEDLSNEIRFEDIKRGDQYQVVINGINQNLWKVSLSSKDSLGSKPQVTPSFGNFSIEALSGLVTGISSQSVSIATSETFKSFDKGLGLLKMYSDFKAAVRTGNEEIIQEMDKQKAFLEVQKGKLELEAIDIDEVKLQAFSVQNNARKRSNPTSKLDYDLLWTTVADLRKIVINLKNETISSHKIYKEYSESKKTAISAIPELIANDKGIKEAYEKLNATITDVQTSISADKTQELIGSLVYIQNNEDNVYRSLPIQFNGEQTSVRLSVTPRDEKSLLHTYSTAIIFPSQLKSYTVVGISFFGSTLYDKAYSSIKSTIVNGSDTTTTYQYQEENVSKGELGIAAMLRYGKKMKDKDFIGFHGTLGAGVTLTSKIKPRLLLGGGLTVGNRHMLAIDLGVVAGYVDRQSSVLQIGSPLSEKSEKVVISKLNVGGFISLGYTYQF